MQDNFLVTVIIVLIVVVAFGAFIKSDVDCHNAHGIYVRKLSGMYACVEQGQH